MILGDSLQVMASLLEREGMRGKVQMIYLDPPYGIKFGSNFQPRIDKREVKDGVDEDLTREVEQVQAFRDTWELGVHSYLSYLRDRLILARELLKDEGSVFVQIGDENVHRVRALMDEVFGDENFVSQIAVKKTGGATSDTLSGIVDHLVWYAKDRKSAKYRQLYLNKVAGQEGGEEYTNVALSDGTKRPLTGDELKGVQDGAWPLPEDAKVFTLTSAVSDGYRSNTSVPFSYQDFEYRITTAHNWKSSVAGMIRLCKANRLLRRSGHRIYVRYLNDFPVATLNNVWMDVRGALGRVYAVQTSAEVVKRCMLMTMDPGDLFSWQTEVGRHPFRARMQDGDATEPARRLFRRAERASLGGNR